MVKKVVKKTVNKKGSGKKIPTGVKVISILNYVGAGLGILFGILMIIAAIVFSQAAFQDEIVNNLLSDSATLEEFSKAFDMGTSPEELRAGLGTVTSLFIGFGIFLIVLSVVSIIVGIGLWKGRSWARITQIVLGVLGILLSFSSLFAGDIVNSILMIIVYGLIVGYLAFNKEAKAYFKK